MAPYTTSEQLHAAHSTLVKTFQSGKTKSIAWRKWQLKQMWWMVSDNEKAIAKALHSDLHRHDFESYYADIGGTKNDILATLSHLEEWAADTIPDAGFIFRTLGGARIRNEPLGVALIIGTWNFPFAVSFMPLVAAISAGCCAMLKPSEVSTASQDLMAEIVPKYLDQDAIQIVTGGPKEASLILEHRFDHIFYTGSPKVGKIVQAAAAKNLTPTVLELGGQAPAIVTTTADINIAAKRIAYTKFMNGGQVCLSTNHVLVDPKVHDQFVKKASFWMDQFMKGKGKDQAVRIINDRNYDRLAGLLSESKGQIAYGGNKDKEDKYIQPTVVTDVTMQG